MNSQPNEYPKKCLKAIPRFGIALLTLLTLCLCSPAKATAAELTQVRPFPFDTRNRPEEGSYVRFTAFFVGGHPGTVHFNGKQATVTPYRGIFKAKVTLKIIKKVSHAPQVKQIYTAKTHFQSVIPCYY